MELKVWVEGIQRIICGVNETTTCQDVVFALAHATGKTGKFTLTERWRNNERLLAPQEYPLKVLLQWGEYSNDVQFILQRSGSNQIQNSSKVAITSSDNKPSVSPERNKDNRNKSFSFSPYQRIDNVCDGKNTTKAAIVSTTTPPDSKVSDYNCLNNLSYDRSHSILSSPSTKANTPSPLKYNSGTFNPDTDYSSNLKKNPPLYRDPPDPNSSQTRILPPYREPPPPTTVPPISKVRNTTKQLLKEYQIEVDDNYLGPTQYGDLIRLINYQRDKLTTQQVELTRYDSEIKYWETNTREQQHQMDFLAKEAIRIDSTLKKIDDQLNTFGSVEEDMKLVKQEDKTLKTEFKILKSKLDHCETELLICKNKIRSLLNEIEMEKNILSRETNTRDHIQKSILSEVDKLQTQVEQAKHEAEIAAQIGDSLNKEVEIMEATINEKKQQVEKFVNEMKKANLQSLAISPPEELNMILDGAQFSKPGNSRKIVGSPRQLESAVPTSKNPHGMTDPAGLPTTLPVSYSTTASAPNVNYMMLPPYASRPPMVPMNTAPPSVGVPFMPLQSAGNAPIMPNMMPMTPMVSQNPGMVSTFQNHQRRKGMTLKTTPATISAPPNTPIVIPVPSDLPKGPPVTVFVGNIIDKAPDLMIRQILATCGHVASWKRVQGFGFCEYANPDAALRAFRLLPEVEISSKNLMVRVDAKAQTVLDEYKEMKKQKNLSKGNLGNDIDKDEAYMDEEMKRIDEISRKKVAEILIEHQDQLQKCKNREDDDSRKGIISEDRVREAQNRLLNPSKNQTLDLGDVEFGDDGKRDIVTREIGKFRENMKKQEEEKEERRKREEETKQEEKKIEKRDRDRDSGDKRSNKIKAKSPSTNGRRSRSYQSISSANSNSVSPEPIRSPKRDRIRSKSRERNRDRDRDIDHERDRRGRHEDRYRGAGDRNDRTRGRGDRDRVRGRDRDNDREVRDRGDRERDRDRMRDRSPERERSPRVRNERNEKDLDREREEEEELKEERRRERLNKEREASYQERLRNWEARERKKAKEAAKEREKQLNREEDRQKEAKKLKKFLEDYDDERDDPKFYKGREMDKRIAEREVEISIDNRDKQKEKEELEELKSKIYSSDSNNPEYEFARLVKAREEMYKPKLLIDVTEEQQQQLRKGKSSSIVAIEERDENNHVADYCHEVDQKSIESPPQQPTMHSLTPSPQPPLPVEVMAEDINRVQPPLPVQSITENNHDIFDDMNNKNNILSANHESPENNAVINYNSSEPPLGGYNRSLSSSPAPAMAMDNSPSPSPDSNMDDRNKLNNKRRINESVPSNNDNDDEDIKRRKLIPIDYNDDKKKESKITDTPKSQEEKRKHIKTLIDKIPTEKSSLFKYELDWSAVDNNLIEKRIRPWINKKIIEYIGEPEQTLVDFICSKVLAGSEPQSILDDVQMVLDDEAEVFVVKMWRLLIYEVEAKKLGFAK